MLSLLFTICMIWFVGKFFVFGLRASWGIKIGRASCRERVSSPV